MVYASATLSLAALEYLVHVNASQVPDDMFAIPAEVPATLKIVSVRVADLSRNWRRFEPPVEELAAIGDAWIRSKRSAVLRVPSAIVPIESNFALNPTHPAFAQIAIGKPEPFSFDRRL